MTMRTTRPSVFLLPKRWKLLSSFRGTEVALWTKAQELVFATFPDGSYHKALCVVWILWLTRNLLFALISFRQGCRKLWASWQSNSFVEKKITSSTMKSCLSPWLIHMGIVYTQGSLLSANPIQSSCWMAVGLCLFLICISDFCLVKFYSKSSQAVLSTKLK